MFGPRLKLELRLHRATAMFALAAGLVVLALIAMTPWGETWVVPGQLNLDRLLMALITLTLLGFYPILLPLMIGACMIAPERAVGVWDWRLSLPESRGRRWARKVCAGVGLNFVLCLMPPAILGLIYAWATGEFAPGAGEGIAFGKWIDMALAATMASFLCMGGGAWASGLASDSLKALCLAVALLGALLAAALTGDPLRLTFSTGFAPAATICGGAFLGLLGFFRWNCRFPRASFRGTAAQLLLALIIFPPFVFLCHSAWGWANSPWARGDEGELRRKAEVIRYHRFPTGTFTTPPDWTGVRPLLVRKSVPEWDWLSLNRRPDSNQAIVMAYYDNGPNNGQFEIDLGSGGPRLGYPLLRASFQKFEEGRDFEIATYPYRVFRVLGGRFPVPVGGWIEKWLRPNARSGADLSAPVFGELTLTAQKSVGLDPKEWGWFENILQPTQGKDQTWLHLFRRKGDHTATGKWVLAERGRSDSWRVAARGDSGRPVISSDRRWIATVEEDRWTTRGLAVADATFAARDGSKEITIPAMGRHLALGYSTQSSEAPNPFFNRHFLPASRDGRYLPFARAEGLEWKTEAFAWDTGFPKKTDLMALDTRAGSEIEIFRDRPPARRSWASFNETLKSDLGLEFWQRQRGKPMPPESMPKWRAGFLPLAWAPGRDRLALVYDGWVEAYDIAPSGGEGKVEAKRCASRDLSGLEINQIEFIDDETLLAWSSWGVYRIDLNASKADAPGGN